MWSVAIRGHSDTLMTDTSETVADGDMTGEVTTDAEPATAGGEDTSEDGQQKLRRLSPGPAVLRGNPWSVFVSVISRQLSSSLPIPVSSSTFCRVEGDGGAGGVVTGLTHRARLAAFNSVAGDELALGMHNQCGEHSVRAVPDPGTCDTQVHEHSCDGWTTGRAAA
jgi:hypothetical protein